jgi:hypothetical protein
MKAKKAIKPKTGRPRSESFEWPIYSSQQACHAATGTPLRILRSTAKSGCPAFRHGRIYFGEWLKWFWSQDAGELENWGDRLKRAQALREEGKLEQDRKAVVDRDFVEQMMQRVISKLFARLDRVFACELPPVLKGRDELAIRERATAAIAEARAGVRSDFEDLANG